LVNAVSNFTKIYSIGNKKAICLYKEHNITTLEELKDLVEKNPTILHNKQKIGLTYYDDLIQRIPRSEMLEYQRVLLDIAKKVDSEIQLSINGSFRRECETSGDIDVLITSNNPTSRKKFIQYLKKEHILIETLANGNKKYMGISKLPTYNTYRHIDIIETTLEEYAFGVLYFTGSGGFNVLMRKHALTKGYTLNEYCLSHYDTKHTLTSEKIQSKIGKSYFETEVDIFQFLEMDYVEPRDRDNITASKM
jgi:DNA polymerase beta